MTAQRPLRFPRQLYRVCDLADSFSIYQNSFSILGEYTEGYNAVFFQFFIVSSPEIPEDNIVSLAESEDCQSLVLYTCYVVILGVIGLYGFH